VLAQGHQLLSAEHFTVDGTLIEAWAGLKSFRKKGAGSPPPDDPGNPTVNFHGERRSNATHASTTDPEARLARKGPGKEAKLAYQGHALMENWHGLVVDTCVTQAVGPAEREAAAAMATNLRRGATVGRDQSSGEEGNCAASHLGRGRGKKSKSVRVVARRGDVDHFASHLRRTKNRPVPHNDAIRIG